MSTIALIGADGSGKTTIAKMLLKEPPVAMKYVYMGLNIESSNYALPTSRFAYKLKLMKYKKKNKELKNVKLKNLSLHTLDDNRSVDPRGRLGAILRLLNRVSEAWYRQLISAILQLRGYVVLFDRHYIFDASTNKTKEEMKKQRITTKIHQWLVDNTYKKPDLVIFLHAPADVLYARKGEADIEYLEARTQSFLKVGENMDNFLVVDATQSINQVYEEVYLKIKDFLISNNKKLVVQ